MFNMNKVRRLEEELEDVKAIYQDYKLYAESSIAKLEGELNTYKQKYDELLTNNNTATHVIKENDNLIDWIYQIIEKVGCYEISKTDCIKIPVMQHDVSRYGYFDSEIGYKHTVIDIPAIKVEKHTPIYRKREE